VNIDINQKISNTFEPDSNHFIPRYIKGNTNLLKMLTGRNNSAAFGYNCKIPLSSGKRLND